MAFSLFSKQTTSTHGRRGFSLALSVAIHGIGFVLLMNAPEIRLPPPGKSEYKQAVEGKEDKVVWYRFNEKLPDIATPRAQTKPTPVRAEARAKQQIVAAPKKAPKRDQFVYSSAPELPDAKPVDAPNLLAIRFEPPAPPAPKLFVPPAPVPAPELAEAKLQTDAPTLDMKTREAVTLPGAQRRITRRFTPPPAPVKAKLADITPPPEAPKLTASLATAPAELPFALKTPGRTFVTPATRPIAPARQAPVEAPPPIANTLMADARDLNLAIVGLKPVDRQTALPTASSPGQFSAAPEIRREGAAAPGDAKGIAVPDLFVRGTREAKPDLIAEAFASPTSAATLRQALRKGAPAITDEKPPAATPLPASSHALGAGAIKVSGAPDPRFNGRDVYMMAIQMPNLTSYSGSWLMWYSDRTAHEAGLAPISPPVAHRKVDPKYIAAAASDKIEGKVQLACVIEKDGSVSTVELVRGLDDRLNRSAEDALAKWEFTPATRQGKPVAVDVLVEIPFRLEPHTPVAF